MGSFEEDLEFRATKITFPWKSALVAILLSLVVATGSIKPNESQVVSTYPQAWQEYLNPHLTFIDFNFYR